MTSHRMTGTVEYHAWHRIKRRCCDERHPDYPQYGGVGVTVCDEWLGSFSAFYDDMGPRPSPEHSIDRMDGKKGYSKENCRWATRSEQSSNRPGFVVELELNGETMNIAAWARKLKMPASTIYRRAALGWPAEMVLATSDLRTT